MPTFPTFTAQLGGPNSALGNIELLSSGVAPPTAAVAPATRPYIAHLYDTKGNFKKILGQLINYPSLKSSLHSGFHPISIMLGSRDIGANLPFPSTPNYFSIIQGDKPVSYWRFDETSGIAAHDVENNAHPGTLNGTVTLNVTGALSQDPNTAMKLDGSTAYIDFGTDSALNFTGTSSFSLEAWVNPSTIDGITRRIWSREKSAAPREGYNVYISNSGGTNNIGFERWNSGTFQNVNTSGLYAPVTGTYIHLVCTYDGSTLRIYINGTLINSSTSTQSLNAITQPLRIGSTSDVVGQLFSGTIDEPAVYNVALSATQILQHYNAGIQKLAPTQGDIVKLTEQGGDGSVVYTGLIEDIEEDYAEAARHEIQLVPLVVELGDAAFSRNYTTATDVAQIVRDAVGQTAHLTYDSISIPNTGITTIFNFNKTNSLSALEEAAKIAGSSFYWFVDEIGKVWFGPTLLSGVPATYTVKQGVDYIVRKYHSPIDKLKNYILGLGGIPDGQSVPLIATYDGDQNGGTIFSTYQPGLRAQASQYGLRAFVPPLTYPDLVDQTTLNNIVATVGGVLNRRITKIELTLINYPKRITLATNPAATMRFWEPSSTSLTETEKDAGTYSSTYTIIDVESNGPIQKVVLSDVPITYDDLQYEIERALQRVQTSQQTLLALQSSQSIAGQETIIQLPVPTIPTIAIVGVTGSTTYAYAIVAGNVQGETSASPTATITNGNSGLNQSNYNKVSWTAVQGATYYKVLNGSGQLMNRINGNQNTIYYDKGQDTALAKVSAAPTVTVTGVGTTTYAYSIVSSITAGDALASPIQTITNGPNTLDGTHFDTITWNAASGATTYKVLRSISGGTTNVIGTVASGSTLTFTDNGTYATGYPTAYVTPQLNPGGILGVGTATPTNPIEVWSGGINIATINSNGNLSITGSLFVPTGKIGVGNSTPAYALDITIGATRALTVDAVNPAPANGNVLLTTGFPKIGFNTLNLGAGQQYTASNFASMIQAQQGTGGLEIHVAPSGTAGNAITWTRAMYLDTSGNVTFAGTVSGSSGQIGAFGTGVTNVGNSAASVGTDNFVSHSTHLHGMQDPITAPSSSTNIGQHPNYGTGNSAFWRTGTDFALITEGVNTFINSPTSTGTIYFRHNNSTGTSQNYFDSIGNLFFGQANPVISSTSYVGLPGGLYVSGGTAYVQNTLNVRGALANDTATSLSVTGGTSNITNLTGRLNISSSADTTGNVWTGTKYNATIGWNNQCRQLFTANTRNDAVTVEGDILFNV